MNRQKDKIYIFVGDSTKALEFPIEAVYHASFPSSVTFAIKHMIKREETK